MGKANLGTEEKMTRLNSKNWQELFWRLALTQSVIFKVGYVMISEY